MKKYQLYAGQVALFSMLSVAGVLVSDSPVEAKSEPKYTQNKLQLKEEELIQVGNYYIEPNKRDNTATIVGYYDIGYGWNGTKPKDKQEETLVIPEQLGGYKITKIDYGTYSNMKYSKVIVPDSDIEYHDYIFEDCEIDELVIEGRMDRNVSPEDWTRKGGTIGYSDIGKLTVKGEKLPDLLLYEARVQELDLQNATEIGGYGVKESYITKMYLNKDKLILNDGAFYLTPITDLKLLVSDLSELKIGSNALYSSEWDGDLDFREGAYEAVFPAKTEANEQSWNGLNIKGNIYDTDTLGYKTFQDISAKNIYWNENNKIMYENTFRSSSIEGLYGTEQVKELQTHTLYNSRVTESSVDFSEVDKLGKSAISETYIAKDMELRVTETDPANQDSLLYKLEVEGDLKLDLNLNYNQNTSMFRRITVGGDMKINLNGEIQCNEVFYYLKTKNLEMTTEGNMQVSSLIANYEGKNLSVKNKGNILKNGWGAFYERIKAESFKHKMAGTYESNNREIYEYLDIEKDLSIDIDGNVDNSDGYVMYSSKVRGNVTYNHTGELRAGELFRGINVTGDITINQEGNTLIESMLLSNNNILGNLNLNMNGDKRIKYPTLNGDLLYNTVHKETNLNYYGDIKELPIMRQNDFLGNVNVKVNPTTAKGFTTTKTIAERNNYQKDLQYNVEGDIELIQFTDEDTYKGNVTINVTGSYKEREGFMKDQTVAGDLTTHFGAGTQLTENSMENMNVGGTANIHIGENSILTGALRNMQLGDFSNISIGVGSRLLASLTGQHVFQNSIINGDIILEEGGNWTSDTWQLNEDANVQNVKKITVGEVSTVGVNLVAGMPAGATLQFQKGVTILPKVFENKEIASHIVIEEPKAIETEAFKNAKIPNGVTIIGNQTTLGNEAFKGAEIGDLKLQGDFSAITGKAFLNATLNQGQGLTVEGKVGEVSDYAFSNTEGKAGADLPYIHFEGGIDRIGDYGLAYTKVRDLQLQHDLQLLGQGAFYGTPITNLAIVGNLQEVRPYAFQGLNKQKVNVLIGGNIDKIGTYGLANIYAEGEKKEEPKSKIQVNGNIGTIADYGLAGKYQEVLVKGRIDKLGNYGLAYTKNQAIKVAQGIRDIGSYAMYVKDPDKPINPEWLQGTQFIRDSAFEASLKGGTVEIPPTVQYLGRASFKDNNLDEVQIKAGIEELEDSVFAGNNLKQLLIPSSVQTIGERATYQNQIACVTLPKATHTVGAEAFNQKPPLVIDVYGSSALKQYEFFAGNPSVQFVENSIFTNNCTVGEWQVMVIGKDTGGNILYTYEVDKPKQGTFRVEAKTLEKYKVKGSPFKEVQITEETPSHIVEFIYEGDNPLPPVEKPEPPVEKPEPPVEKPEPPVEKPEPPVEKPEPPVEKPEPPVEKPEPPVEKPEPPTEPSEPNEKPEPPVEKPEPPTEPSNPVTGEEQMVIQNPLEKEETDNEGSEITDTEKEETLPKTGTEKETAGLWGLLLGMLGFVLIRKK